MNSGPVLEIRVNADELAERWGQAWRRWRDAATAVAFVLVMVTGALGLLADWIEGRPLSSWIRGRRGRH